MQGPKGFKYGVDVVLEGGEIETFDGVVVCAGVHSRDLAAQLGDRVNIYPVKGYSITVNLNDEASRAAAPWVSLLDDKASTPALPAQPPPRKLTGHTPAAPDRAHALGGPVRVDTQAPPLAPNAHHVLARISPVSRPYLDPHRPRSSPRGSARTAFASRAPPSSTARTATSATIASSRLRDGARKQTPPTPYLSDPTATP